MFTPSGSFSALRVQLETHFTVRFGGKGAGLFKGFLKESEQQQGFWELISPMNTHAHEILVKSAIPKSPSPKQEAWVMEEGCCSKKHWHEGISRVLVRRDIQFEVLRARLASPLAFVTQCNLIFSTTGLDFRDWNLCDFNNNRFFRIQHLSRVHVLIAL